MHVQNIYQENLYDKYHQLRNKFGIKMTGIPLDDETQDIITFNMQESLHIRHVIPSRFRYFEERKKSWTAAGAGMTPVIMESIRHPERLHWHIFYMHMN